MNIGYDYKGFRMGDLVQKNGSDDQYYIVGFEELSGVVYWEGIKDGVNRIFYFSEWDITVICHYDHDQFMEVLRQITG